MVRKELGLTRDKVGEPRLEDGGNPAVELAPSTLKQRGVGDVLDQRMLERIDRLGRRAALKDELRLHEPGERLVEISRFSCSDCIEKLVGELTADGGADLGQILGRSQVIEPGHERVLQTRRNGKRATRCDQRETLGRVAQHA